MKFVIAFALIVAVASAGVVRPVGNDDALIDAIIAAINSPSTDPATAVLLQQQLADLLGVAPPSPVIVDPISPVLVVDEASPVAPVVIPPVVNPVPPVAEPAPPAPPAPPATVVNPTPASSPLVQVILNINAPPGVVGVGPAAPPSPPADPVNVVDEAVNDVPTPDPVVLPPGPVIVAPPGPVIVAPPPAPAPEPIVVGDPVLPNPVLPIIVGEPTLPVFPAVIPETLN